MLQLDDVHHCVQAIGHQLKGLKIQCKDVDFTEVVQFCPNLVTLVIQKENPRPTIRVTKLGNRSGRGHLQQLQTLEITNNNFPKDVFNFFMRTATNLLSVKAYHVKDLCLEDVESWTGHLLQLKTLMIFRGPEMRKEAVDEIIQILPKLKCLGNLGNFDIRDPEFLKKITARQVFPRYSISPKKNTTKRPFRP